jgi:hypothetical protein
VKGSDKAQNMPANSSAALLVFEHLWAKRLATAIRNADGILVAEGFVRGEVVEQIAALREEAAKA